MAKDRVQPITGFPEWNTGEKILEQRFIDTIRKTFERFGFSPLETAAVERDDTLASKGEINQQIYSLFRPNVPQETDHQTGLSLHFDLTLPLARYVAQNAGKLVFPFRRYQIQKVWRGERAQRGRFREFYQCDIDVVGDRQLDLLVDAEMPAVIAEVLTELDVGAFVIRLSNRKVLAGYLAAHQVQEDLVEEVLRGIDRLPKLRGGWPELADWFRSELELDSAVITALEELLSIQGAPAEVLKKIPSLCTEETFQTGVRELGTVIQYLQVLGVAEHCLELDLSITRGLDYYTGTVYETFLVGREAALGSICSGGRYDHLAAKFTDKQYPGVGMSIGLTRLFAGLLEAGRIAPDTESMADVLVTVPDRSRLKDALHVSTRLRSAGLNAELFVQDARHDKQLKTAVRKGIPFAVIPWPDAIDQQDSVELRNLQNGDKELVLVHEVAAVIRFVLEKLGRSKHV